MQFHVSNIGKISDASIALDGLTVIAGENDRGKSTLGKALFAAINPGYDRTERMNQWVRNKLRRFLSFNIQRWKPAENRTYLAHRQRGIAIEALTDAIIAVLSDKNGIDEPDTFVQRIQEELPESAVGKEALSALSAISVHKEELFKNSLEITNVTLEEFLVDHATQTFSSMFADAVVTETEPAQDIAKAWITDKTRTVLRVRLNHAACVEYTDSFDEQKSAILIDNPSMLEYVSDPAYYYTAGTAEGREASNIDQIRRRNKREQIVVAPEAHDIIEFLNGITPVVVDNDDDSSGSKLRDPRLGNQIPVANGSMGTKSVVLLKTLLSDGTLQPGTFLILDEPEIHLHPQWQLKYAEALVLLMKKMNVHVLVTTHSPYFLKALRVYAQKYSVADKHHVYSAEGHKNGTVSFYEVKGQEKWEELYETMISPFDDIEGTEFRLNEGLEDAIE